MASTLLSMVSFIASASLVNAPTFLRVEGDTISPIEITLSASCKTNTIKITYRNSWIEGFKPLGLQSLEVNGSVALDAMSTINRAIKNARIEKLSTLYCYADRGVFKIHIEIDSADIRRLNLEKTYVFSIDEKSAWQE